MMSSFSTSTTAYTLIHNLSTLRQTNPGLAYGGTKERGITSAVYILERKFFKDGVLTAINKNDTTAYNISGLNTALPPATYSDYLSGLLGGSSITVGSGSGGNNPVTTFSLPAHTVAVWHSVASATSPEVGSIGPTVGQPGPKRTIAGKGFGSSTGSVLVGTTAATINSWSDTSVTFTVPSVGGGGYSVQLKNSGGTAANPIQVTVLPAKLRPAPFTETNTG